MNGALYIVCPHCDTVNRVPRERLADGGRCGECRRALFNAHPAALNTERFARHLEKSDLPLLIDFWAEWCGPCRVMAPEFERAAAAIEPRARLGSARIPDGAIIAEQWAIRPSRGANGGSGP